ATTLAGRRISLWIGRRAGSAQPRRVLIVGAGREAVRLRRLLRSIRPAPPVVVGHLGLSGDEGYGQAHTGATLGGVDDLAGVLDRHVIDEVLFATPLDELHRVLPYIAVCEEVGVSAGVPAQSVHCRSTLSVVDLHGLPLVNFAPARHSPELMAIKRVADVVL